MEKYTIRYEGKPIYFTLVRKKVKNVNLKVRPDSTVVVSANKAVPHEYIEELVVKRAPWILKNIKHFDEKRSTAGRREYVTGETVYYLGEQYLLQVLPKGRKEEIILDGEKVFLFIKEQSNLSRKEQLFNLWYKEKAKMVFQQSLERIYPLLTGHGIKKPSITIRTMKTRWGSCSFGKQKITLNTELVKTPITCIDYVVLHELAHFKHRRHDARFYGFLYGLMPDWKERRQVLRGWPAGSTVNNLPLQLL